MRPAPSEGAHVRLISCDVDNHAAAILDIFNEAIASSTALYDYKARAPESMVGWFKTKEANRFPVIGAIYEILWIGMVIVLFGMPFYSFIMWVKNKFDFRSLYLYSFLISSIGILVLITQFD